MNANTDAVDQIMDVFVTELMSRHNDEINEKNMFIENLIVELRSTYDAIDRLKMENLRLL